METCHDISEGPDNFFHLPFHKLDRSRIEPRSGQLNEVALLPVAVCPKFDPRQINFRFALLTNNFPRILQFRGNAKFASEHVYRAERKHGQTRALETVFCITN